MWYSPHAQVTYNRIFNFVVGVRGGGKTFNLIRFCIDQYKKYGHEFIYLRRRQVHLDDACPGTEADDLFADIRNKDYFKEHKLKVKGDKAGGYNFYFDDKIMGYGKALSTSSGRRSSSKPKVKYVIYDEFLIDDSIGTNERYLNHGEEMFIFNNFYETIARGRDIQCFFIGNAFSMVNPYFLSLDIRIHNPEDNKIYKGKTVVIGCHSHTIKSILSVIEPDLFTYRTLLVNGAIAELKVDDEGIKYVQMIYNN